MNVGFSAPNYRQSSFIASSFDGHQLGRCDVQRPDRYAFFDRNLTSRHMIARGAGLSYASASFGKRSVSIDMRSFDRILDFSAKEQTVKVEAGLRLRDLHLFLARKGLYLPVQPGHGSISVGGCIAADVHGKNQRRDGTFFRQVLSLTLFHPRHGMVELAADKNPELFTATCGGYGTTGIIISARLRATGIPSYSVELEFERIGSVQDIIPQLLAAQQYDFMYSWHNLTALNEKFGHGYLIKARFADRPATPLQANGLSRRRNLSARSRSSSAFCFYNRLSTKLINLTQDHVMRWNSGRVQTLDRVLFPIHGSEAYFSAFGKSGFHEYQALIPPNSFERYISGLKVAVRKRRVPITLASAKLFGGDVDLLRFSGEGVCFALNFPKSPRAADFLNELDRLLIEVGGRPNIIKDSRLPQAVVSASYPQYDRFREIISVWDPERIFRSELTDRIEI